MKIKIPESNKNKVVLRNFCFPRLWKWKSPFCYKQDVDTLHPVLSKGHARQSPVQFLYEIQLSHCADGYLLFLHLEVLSGIGRKQEISVRCVFHI